MDIDLTRSAEQFHNRHRRDRIWKKLVSVLCCVVVFCTTYALILPAITMERETICGIQEHQHGEGCYTQQEVRHLACRGTGVHTHTAACADGRCGYGDFALHTHDGSCYEGGRLVCNLPEVKAHTHADDCYQIPTWEEPGHTHTDACYTDTKGKLVCGKTETEGHTHSEACYGQKQVLVCAEPESDGHHHGDGCYDEAGVLICEAEESDGHHHGEACYKTETLLICGKTEAEPHQHVDTCYKQERKLTCTEKEGPIVRQGDPELVCGRQEIEAHQHSAACFDADNQWICGKREILSHTHTDACFETVAESVLTCGLEEHTHSDECYPAEETTTETTESTTEATTEETVENLAPAMFRSVLFRSSETAPTTGQTTAALPGVTLSGNNTTYDPLTDTFSTNVLINFQFMGDTGKPNVGTVYTYTYPAGISVPDDIVKNGEQSLYDGDKLAGTYQFVSNGDGTYSVQVIFNKDYVDTSGNTVTGFVQFNGSFSKADMNDAGNIVVGAGDNVLTIPGSEITYPDEETESYNIDVSKSGSWVQDGDKLVYTVYVRTTKGTPDSISFTDTITATGMTLGTPTVTIEKGTSNYYYADWDKTWKPTDNNNWSEVSNITPKYENGKLEISLPKLSAEKTKDSNNADCIIGDVYKITYTYPITDQTVASVSPKNNVTVSAKDETTGKTITDSAKTTVDVSKDFSYTLDKSGAVASDKPGYIKWTVTVNDNGQNIAGAKLTDQMLGLVGDTANDIAISPVEGATVTKDENGKITDITFAATENGVNKNKYTITYYTPVEESWDGTTVTNKATLDPKPDETGDEKEATASVKVSGVQLNKQGQFNGATNQIDWTITVNSGNLDIAGATLTDEMFAALSETAFTIAPSTGYSFTKDDAGKITGIIFAAVADGKNTQSYTIKYSTDVTENEDGTTSSVTNSATLSPGEGKEGTPIGDEATVTPDTVQVTKSGSYTWDKKISWTITVNASKLNIAGAVLTDEMFSRLTANDITIQKNGGENPDSSEYTVAVDENGKITSITFHAIGDTGVNTNQYTITYYTDEPQEWNDKTVRNEAKLTLDGKEIPGTADVSVPGDGSIAKSAGAGVVDGTTMTIPWTVTLTVPKGGLPKDTTIVDDVTRNQWNTNKNQWMTSPQINALQQMTWTDDNGNSKDVYSLPAGCLTPVGTGDKYTGFTITLPESLIPPEGATKLTFTYFTTVDLTETTTGGNKFYNDIQVGGKETGAEYTYYKPGVVKTDGNGNTGNTTVSNEGALTWKIKATVGTGNKRLTLTDTLPEGVTLDSLQLTGWGNLNMALTVADGEISGADSTNQYTVRGTYSDNTVTLTITPKMEGNDIQTGAEFVLTVNCTVTDAQSQTETKTLTNRATMKLDDVEIGSSSQTQEWTYQNVQAATKVIDKSGDWDNNNRIMNYTVVLNPDGDDLVEGVDTLTLIDTMTYINQVWLQWPFDNSIAYSINASLIQSSVNLSAAVWNEGQGKWTAGAAVTGWSWTYEATTSPNSWETNKAINTITATGVPDGTPLMLQYSYRITSNVPDEINGTKTYFDLNFSNTARLEGTTHSDENSSSGMEWKHSDVAAGAITDKSYTFYKVEAGNYNVSLEGAKFSVYRYDTSTGSYGEAPVNTYTTGDSGTFQITHQEKDASGNVTFSYDTNTLYKVTETSPPEGYILPANAKSYYFYFSSTEDTTHTLPENLPAGAVNLTNETGNAYVENVKNTTEITVEKKWQDKNGNEVSRNSGSVTINLYQKTSQGSSSGGGSGEKVTVTVDVHKNSYNSDSACTQNLTVDCVKGTQFTLTVNTWGTSVIYANGEALSYSSQSSGDSGSTNYHYQFEVSQNTTITGYAYNDNEGSVTYSCTEYTGSALALSESGTGENTNNTSEGTLYKVITLDASNNWTHTFTNLPLTGTDTEGNTVNYYYYVQEVSVSGYETSYGNNGGIQSGTITVTNTATSNPTYELPDTGGHGTMGYTLGGVTLTAGAALWLLCRRKRRREAL